MTIRLLLLLPLIWSCASTSKSYYMLSADGPAPSGGGPGIGVGPVNLAEYLDRPNVVVQDAPHRLAVAEDHRWAGELSASVARVVATNVGRQLKSGNVRTYPWGKDSEVDYQVTLDVRQLHGGADGYAVIEAGWRVYSLPDRRLKASRTFVDREPLERDGYPALMKAQSLLLSRLSAEIASAIR